MIQLGNRDDKKFKKTALTRLSDEIIEEKNPSSNELQSTHKEIQKKSSSKEEGENHVFSC